MASTTEENAQVKKRRVLMGMPIHSGSLPIEVAMRVFETLALGNKYEMEVTPLFIMGEAFIQKARNEIFNKAYLDAYDDLVFIDSDVVWNPLDFYKLLMHDNNQDMTGGVYRKKKADVEEYPILVLNPNQKMKLDKGLIEVKGLPGGFWRLPKNVITKIYESTPDRYGDKKEQANVFQPVFRDGNLYSEDFSLCLKWADLGGKCFLDPSILLKHIGSFGYTGSFAGWAMNNGYLEL